MSKPRVQSTALKVTGSGAKRSRGDGVVATTCRQLPPAFVPPSSASAWPVMSTVRATAAWMTPYRIALDPLRILESCARIAFVVNLRRWRNLEVDEGADADGEGAGGRPLGPAGLRCIRGDR